MVMKGSAKYTLFGSTVVENTVIESQNYVTVDFTWSHVESILETPPLSSTATLVSSSQSWLILFIYNIILYLKVCKTAFNYVVK